MANVAPTYAEFVAKFTEFASLPQGVVTAALSFSSRSLAASSWGDFYSDAVELDTGHTLALQSQLNGSAGGAASIPAGPVNFTSGAGVSVSFQVPTIKGNMPSTSWYQRTLYGQQFLLLQSRVIPRGIMVF